MNGKIQPTIAVEVYSESAERGILQRRNPLYAAGGQDAKGCRFIVAAQIESFVKGLVSRFDGFGAKQLIQPFPRPDSQPCREFPVHLTQHPLTGVDLLLVLFPQAGLLPLNLADFRQPDGTQLRGQPLIGSCLLYTSRCV